MSVVVSPRPLTEARLRRSQISFQDTHSFFESILHQREALTIRSSFFEKLNPFLTNDGKTLEGNSDLVYNRIYSTAFNRGCIYNL